MDFVIGLSMSTNWNRHSYDSILVIIDWLTKIVYYKLVKITIDVPGLAKVIINMVVQYHGLFNLIVTNRSLLFTSKFWSLLYYFFKIKRRLSTIFYLQTNSQTKRQNSTLKAYLKVFVNIE